LANLTDKILLRGILDKYRPEVVFHAAAYKHVPLLEINPWEAIYNNILASKNLIEASLEYNVGTFVLVSTDKAVRPTNVMGASKRITEFLLRAHMHDSMRCMAVRFGNVIGSSGSVIPFFLKQIKAGKPVTVTHPEVTRYFMTIGEAAQLIIQAGGMGVGGETFLIKMGQPVRIRDIAADLIRLCGKIPYDDVPIVFTGLRPGEKLYEELITAEEDVIPTPHEKLMKLRADLGGTTRAEREEFRAALLGKLTGLIQCADSHDASGIKRILQEIVPEYTPYASDGCVL
jgi:FlaA1/EpsC-like NDP-sugar epimerase